MPGSQEGRRRFDLQREFLGATQHTFYGPTTLGVDGGQASLGPHNAAKTQGKPWSQVYPGSRAPAYPGPGHTWDPGSIPFLLNGQDIATKSLTLPRCGLRIVSEDAKIICTLQQPFQPEPLLLAKTWSGRGPVENQQIRCQLRIDPHTASGLTLGG